MTDTTLGPPGINQFCGRCGAPVKTYWNACPACETPLAVTPVGAYDRPRTGRGGVAPTASPPPAGAPPATSAPTAPTAPAAPRRAPRAWPPAEADSHQTQKIPAWTPDPPVPAPTPAWTSDPAPAAAPAWPADPPAATPQSGAPTASVPSAWSAPAPPGNTPPPSPGWSPPPSPGYSAPGYPPPGGGYTTGNGYAPPQGGWGSTSQYPAATTTYQQPPLRDEPRPKSSRSGPPWLVVIVLIVVLLAVGVFAGISATSLSSKNNDLTSAKATLTATKAQLDKITTARDQALSQLTDAKATVDSQGAQIKGYKTCVNDLNTAGADLRASNNAAFVAADKQAQKDCLPLGLTF